MAKVNLTQQSFLGFNIPWAVSTQWFLELTTDFADTNKGGDSNIYGYWSRRLIPVESVNERLASLTVGQIAVGHILYNYPEIRGTPKALAITLLDDDTFSLTRLFQRWMDFIMPLNGSPMKPLSVAVKRVLMHKTDRKRNFLYSVLYSCFPQGEITYNGTGNPQLHRINVELIVVSESIVRY